MTGLQWKLVAGAIALAAALGFAGAWIWQANAYRAKLATQESNHSADLASIANAGAKQAREAVEGQQRAQQALADLDAKRTKEKADDLAENERLRRAYGAAGHGLHVAGTCSAGGGSVSKTASATGVDHAGTVELAEAAGRNIFDIRAGIIADQASLRALQDYVRSSCR